MIVQRWANAQLPFVLYGPASNKGYLFLHGQGGNKEEAAPFADIAVPLGYQVLALDLPEHGERKATPGFVPWLVVPELQKLLGLAREKWESVSLRANSIGAYFAMLAFQNEPLDKALFVSPIVDMEELILALMARSSVSESELKEKGEIGVPSGPTLSWRYLTYAREHPLSSWKTPSAILYGGKDNLTPRASMLRFAREHQAVLSIEEEAEHWFHTPQQLAILQRWEKGNI